MSQAFKTQEVVNQPPALTGANFFTSDPVLVAMTSLCRVQWPKC